MARNGDDRKYIRVTSGVPFVIDPAKEKLATACCSCNHSDDWDFSIADDGKIVIFVEENRRRTAALRRPKRRKTKWRR